MDQVELSMLVDIGLKFYAVASQPTRVTMRSMSLVVDLIDLVTKQKSGELRCPATALISFLIHSKNRGITFHGKNFCTSLYYNTS